jgi:hypothetical protein
MVDISIQRILLPGANVSSTRARRILDEKIEMPPPTMRVMRITCFISNIKFLYSKVGDRPTWAAFQAK